MWSGFSATATAALAGNCQVALKVIVQSPAGLLLEDITYALDPSSPGTVVEDETAAVRRTCTLNLVDLSLVPENQGDLLHPLSGNEIVIYRGVTYNTYSYTYNGDGTVATTTVTPTTELAPLGIFSVSAPTITDTGNQLTLQVTGNDRSALISLASWTGAYTAAANQTIPTAIKGIINNRWHGQALTFNLFPSTIVVPKGTTLGIQYTSYGTQAETGSTSGGNDPWQDCVNFAASAGCELFFDRQGTVVMRQIPEPGTGPTVASFSEGAGCTVQQGTRSFDTTKFYNGVIVIGTGNVQANSDSSTSPATPVVGSAYSSDPVLGPSGPLGSRPDFIVDQTISTLAQANAAAAAQLSKVMSEADNTGLTAVDNPALDAGDQISLARARMKLDGSYIISQITHPLDASTGMSITNRAFTVTL